MKHLVRSAVYRGWVRHRRFVPKPHKFRYPIFMFSLDLDELPKLFSQGWLRQLNRLKMVTFRRQDYFYESPKEQAQGSLPIQTAGRAIKSAVVRAVTDYYTVHQLGDIEISRVSLVTHLRYFGFIFNPVSFYYCFDEDGKVLAILSEITNTPWGERHSYILPCTNTDLNSDCAVKQTVETKRVGDHKYQFEFEKAFHVSPFNPMNMQYRWVFSELAQSVVVHMDSLVRGSEQGHAVTKHFDATVRMQRVPIEQAGRLFVSMPAMTLQVVMGIYWQAFRLFVKRTPFYDHPESDSDDKQRSHTQNVCHASRPINQNGEIT